MFINQVAIITGAASGLGFAIAEKLLLSGCQVAAMDQNASALKNSFSKFQQGFKLYSLDVTNENEVKNTVQKITEDFGTLHILINCAGITGITNVKTHQTETENVKKVFDINFMGSYYTSKYVLPIMMTNNYGRILHIASIAGKEGNAGMLAYSASKAAVIGMTKVQGKEYAEYNITINALAPAVIQTALVDALPTEQVKYMTDKIPMKRCGTLTEAANLAAYIVSLENSFSTAFVFDLSGGRATY